MMGIVILAIEAKNMLGRKNQRYQMPARKRIKTQYPGVYYVESTVAGSNKQDKIYYIMYRRNGKLVEEKAGGQSQNNMTPFKATTIRDKKIHEAKANKEDRKEFLTKKVAKHDRWTVDRLWESYEVQRKKTQSFNADKSRYKLYLKKPLGSKELKNLVPLDIDRLRIKYLKEKSPQTVKHILGIIKRLHYFSIKKNLAPALSFAIKMPKVVNKKTEDLSPEQIIALFHAIDESKHNIPGAMMKTALFTGMRRGEMFGLIWDDIDFERGFIFIRESQGRVSQKIPLNEPTRQILNALPRTSKYVFPGRSGRQRITVTREVNAIKYAAGLPKDFRPLHGLRHTYASMLASSGKVDMYTLQRLLTHKSPQMTQRYAHLRDEAIQKAADLVGTIISQAMEMNENKEPLKKESLDINQYDISKKVVNKNIRKKSLKNEKNAITGMKQLKIPGLG